MAPACARALGISIPATAGPCRRFCRISSTTTGGCRGDSPRHVGHRRDPSGRRGGASLPGGDRERPPRARIGSVDGRVDRGRGPRRGAVRSGSLVPARALRHRGTGRSGQTAIAIDAYRRFGKGHHPAALNLGDVFSYALARRRGCRCSSRATTSRGPTSRARRARRSRDSSAARRRGVRHHEARAACGQDREPRDEPGLEGSECHAEGTDAGVCRHRRRAPVAVRRRSGRIGPGDRADRSRTGPGIRTDHRRDAPRSGPRGLADGVPYLRFPGLQPARSDRHATTSGSSGWPGCARWKRGPSRSGRWSTTA